MSGKGERFSNAWDPVLIKVYEKMMFEYSIILAHPEKYHLLLMSKLQDFIKNFDKDYETIMMKWQMVKPILLLKIWKVNRFC